MSDKLDVKKLDRYRAPHGAFRILELPPVDYLMIDGEGDPNTRAFSEAVEALYPLAYTLKFASKRHGVDYVVPPLEGLWWADDMTTFTSARDKSRCLGLGKTQPLTGNRPFCAFGFAARNKIAPAHHREKPLPFRLTCCLVRLPACRHSCLLFQENRNIITGGRIKYFFL